MTHDEFLLAFEEGNLSARSGRTKHTSAWRGST